MKALESARESRAVDQVLDPEEFFRVLAAMCRWHRVPFEQSLLAQKFPPPYDRDALLDAAQALGFRAARIPCSGRRVAEFALPCVAFPRAASRPVLITHTDGERFIYVESGSDLSRTALVGEFEQGFEPEVILVAREPEESTAPIAGFDEEPRKFGFRWFVPALARHRSIWRDVLLASLAIQVVGLTTPLLTQVTIDKVIVHHTYSTLLAVALGLAMFLVFNAVMSWLRQYLVLHTGNRVDAVLAAEVLRHLLRLPLPYFEHRPTGTTVARLQAVETIREFVTGAAMSFILDAPFLIVVIAVMFWYSWQLSLIALAVVALLAGLSVLVTPVLRERINRQFMLGARNQAFLTEYVAGAETVKALQVEPLLERRYGDYLAGYLSSAFATRQLANSYNVVANALEQVMTVAILVAGALLVMRADGFTIGMLVAFQMFAARMAQPMLRIAGLWQEFQQANIAVKRLGDIMDAPAEPHSVVPTRAKSEAPSRIELQALSFRYHDSHPYLYRGLNLRIEPGTLILFAGPSGCGKSTLAKLLLGFYQPTEGRILLDGRDLRHLSANELRQAFGVVLQETLLFSGTLYDNLAMANPHASFEDIVAACKKAEIHETIERLPQGYRTEIGEHGVGLSGGQKQRIAIARALLKQPRILIFDEATSGLDAPTAESLARTINQLKGSATIVFIAHQIPRGLAVDEACRFGVRAQARAAGSVGRDDRATRPEERSRQVGEQRRDE
ncbi:MAG: peptidase domain-containing ABC transporter [Betaproteobacteria bacterium]|nr:peptidase domain-containing ABC transporter [Betaproteobacteria bacterium]